MDSVTFNIYGFDKLIEKFHKLDVKVKTQLKDEVSASARKIQSDAKRNAPANLGTLRGSIYVDEKSDKNKFLYIIGTKVKYAPYIEFGTPGTQSKTNMKIPPGYEDFANQFKGKSDGKFKDMVLALMDWGLKNGYIKPGKGARQHAYFMALKILRKGIRAQAFLIPAFEAEKKKLKNRIKEILTNA